MINKAGSLLDGSVELLGPMPPAAAAAAAAAAAGALGSTRPRELLTVQGALQSTLTRMLER